MIRKIIGPGQKGLNKSLFNKNKRKLLIQSRNLSICCEGNNKDVKQHWFPQLWPQASTTPKKDMFHAQKKVHDSLQSSNPLKITFARMLSTACIGFSKTSQTHVLKHYKEKEKGSKG